MRGGVERKADRVCRPTERWSKSVHALLEHLQTADFDGSPRPLSISSAWSCVSYMAGWTASERPWPQAVWTNEVLADVGRLIKQYHDKVHGFRPASTSVWHYAEGGCGEGEVVCHNDLGPTNTVLDGGRVAGFIDWEDAEPASALWDLAHAAWWWVPLLPVRLRQEVGAPPEDTQLMRLNILSHAYGSADPASILAQVEPRVRESLRRQRTVTVQAGGHRAYARDLELTLAYLKERVPLLCSMQRL